MANRAVTRTVLTLAIALSTGAPAVSRGDEATDKLEAKRDGANRALRAEEAKIAALRAEARGAEVDLIMARYPEFKDRAAIDRALRTNPQVGQSLVEIARARRVVDKATAAAADEAGQNLTNFESNLKAAIEAAMAASDAADPADPGTAKAVATLAAQLKANPVPPSKAPDRLGVFLLDLEDGGVTAIVDEHDPGLTYCGSVEWTADGTRITYDATPAPGNLFAQTRMKALSAGEKGPATTDLGPGNCPTSMHDAGRMVFLLNPGAVPNAEAGVWTMKADGSARRPLCEYGRPKFSPMGSRLMVSSFGSPKEISLFDLTGGTMRPLNLAGLRVESTPAWADEGTAVAVVGTDLGQSIALLDLTGPDEVRVKEVLWKRADWLDLKPAHPAYCSATGVCAFVGWDAKGMALYTVGRGAGVAKRLEPGDDVTLSAPAFSPDGRYLVFVSDRPAGPKK